ncbi:hypothetical protein BH11PLA1_BH11PLA1_17940 [soil metagenome]
MELENRSRFPALLFRFVVEEEDMGASLLCRATYTLTQRAGVTTPALAAEQSWPVSPGPWACDYGPMDPDELFYRGGADVIIFGSARAPGGQPVTTMDVTVSVGTRFRRTLKVFGDRRWVQRGAALAISEPAEFIAMPLTLAHAFGGKDTWDELEMPFPANPIGKGYAVVAESAAGKPLPNIEDAANLITKWDDRPDPVGAACPGMAFGPRAAANLVIDPDTQALTEIKPWLFNSGFPQLVVTRLTPGEVLRVEGVSAAGPIELTLPPCPVRLRYTQGESVHDMTPLIDQVALEPDLNRMFIAWRQPFRYRMKYELPRTCVLFPVDPADVAPPRPVPLDDAELLAAAPGAPDAASAPTSNRSA